MLPPKSLPKDKGWHFMATIPADPPEDPPHEKALL